MSVDPIDTHPDPRTFAADLRQRLIDEGKPEEEITTDIRIWATGNYLVKVWHVFDHESNDTQIRVQYTRHPDGTIERRRLKFDTPEMWEIIDEQIIDDD